MRARSFLALACAICTGGAFSCSDDGESQDTPMLTPTAGSGGASNGGSANGGSSNGGSSNGGSANGGSSQGGSTNPGNAGSAGMAGSTMGEAGSSSMPDAGGGDDEPDAGGPDPVEDPISFSEVHPILVENCGGCHGNPQGLPGFAQANEAAAYAETQETGNGGQQIAQRIIVRAVTQRTMPPACGGGALGTGQCLSAEEAADLQAWVADGADP
jgi:hypothetical protein